MIESSYLEQLLSFESKSVKKYVDQVLPKIISEYVSLEFLKNSGITNDDIKELVSIKVLLIRDENSYFLSIPSLGAIRVSITEGRKALINHLKRNPDPKRDDLERKTVDESIFYSTYHLEALIGLGIVKVYTPNGRESRIRLVYDPTTK